MRSGCQRLGQKQKIQRKSKPVSFTERVIVENNYAKMEHGGSKQSQNMGRGVDHKDTRGGAAIYMQVPHIRQVYTAGELT